MKIEITKEEYLEAVEQVKQVLYGVCKNLEISSDLSYKIVEKKI